MRTDNIKVTITIPIPYDKPDKNGNIYTEEAVEKNCEKNLIEVAGTSIGLLCKELSSYLFCSITSLPFMSFYHKRTAL